jgi:hypothetical protein
MVEYPRALRIAHRVVYFHPGDARAFVAGKIADAEQADNQTHAAEWRKVAHFVERLLDESGVTEPAPPGRRRFAFRPRRPRASLL